MVIVDQSTHVPARPVLRYGPIATAAVVVGVAGAAIGLWTPAFAYYLPAALGIAVIVLAVIGFEAKGRAWTALVLGALMLAEAVYGVFQVSGADHALMSFVDGSATVTSSATPVVDLRLGTTYVGSTLSIGLSSPVAYAPSGSAVLARRTGRAVTFNIAVDDRSATRSLSLASLDVQADSGDTQDENVVDTVNGVGPSTATILPGRSLVWQIAFTVPADARDITVQVSSVDGDRTLAFTGSL